MADNTTLYIIIGVALLFTLMRANAESSESGAPAMSAYLRAVDKKRRSGKKSA